MVGWFAKSFLCPTKVQCLGCVALCCCWGCDNYSIYKNWALNFAFRNIELNLIYNGYLNEWPMAIQVLYKQFRGVGDLMPCLIFLGRGAKIWDHLLI